MTFKEIYDDLLKGKKIRRRDWREGKCVFLDSDKLRFVGMADCSLSVVLSGNWEIIEPPKLFSFQEAWKALEEGKRVKIDGCECYFQDGELRGYYDLSRIYIPISWINRTDFEVVEE